MEDDEQEGDEHSPEEEEEEGEKGDEEEEKEKKEGEEEEKEEEEVPAPCPLTEEVLKEGLSLLCKTGNGLSHTYVKLEAKGKNLTDISLLESFIHLRYVDLSENKLQDLSPLSGLTELLWLKVDGNLLTSACMQELSYLQVISFDRNRIKDMEGITHPRLATLSLKENKIQTMVGLSQDQLFSLQVLELRGNKLKSTAGLSLPKLKKLYLVAASLDLETAAPTPLASEAMLNSKLRTWQFQGMLQTWPHKAAQTNIHSLEGLEGLEQLEILHLRDNKLETLDGFSSSMKCLHYLNLRNNGISSFQEVEKLQVLPMLQALVLLENPCADEPNYRLEVLALLPHLQRLDKEAVEQDEKEEAMKIRQTRQEEKEKEMEGALKGDASLQEMEESQEDGVIE